MMSILIPATKIVTMATTLGGHIQKLREASGWTQDELGARIGRPKSWISNIESGRKKNLPEPHEVRLLAKALSVPMSELLAAAGYADDEREQSPDDEAIAQLTALMRQVRKNRLENSEVGRSSRASKCLT